MATELSLTPEQAVAIDKLGGIAVETIDVPGGTDGAEMTVTVAKAVLQNLDEVLIAPNGDHGVPSRSVDLTGKTLTGPDVSLASVIKELRRPFTPAAVKWKVQAEFGGADPHTALIVGYVDARLVTERLNLVCPGDWYEGDAKNPTLAPFQPVDWSRGAMLCRLTVCGVTRQDIGFGKDAKALVSDALKRAAVKFGIAVSVYATPQVRLNLESGYVKVYKKRVKNQQGQWGDKKTLVLTDGGKEYLPKFYTRWLWEHGVDAFGLPLDHGDSSLSVGDVESGLEMAEPDEDTPVDENTQQGIAEMAAAIKPAKKGTSK